MARNNTQTVILVLIVFWFLVVMYIALNVTNSNSGDDSLERELVEARHELEVLRSGNKEVSDLLQQIKVLQNALANKSKARPEHQQPNENLQNVQQTKPQEVFVPDIQKAKNVGLVQGQSVEQEHMRRRAEEQVEELWYYIRHSLNEIHKVAPESIKPEIVKIKNRARDQQHTVMAYMHNMSQGLEAWRARESAELSELVQHRFDYLQNPSNCANAPKVVCNLNKGCGYGCQLHHVMYCFTVAYGMKRALILESRNWRYAGNGWETLFLPLSETCPNNDAGGAKAWSGPSDFSPAIALPIVDSLHPRPEFLPLSIPEDIASRLMKVHGNPAVWWTGQIIKFITRPQPKWKNELETKMKQLDFQHPIVGVHVRRTDKVNTEAAFHGIDEYMEFVEAYFDRLEKIQGQPVAQRRIYLASDEPAVHQEAREKYPHYKVVSEPEFAQIAGPSSRYSEASLRGVVSDIYFLSRCDYVVCTFSSQVCRAAYEDMQTLHPDASSFFYSLDDIYYFGGQHAHNKKALFDHVAGGDHEISMKAGDYVGIAGNHWDGMSKGRNVRTGREGLFPSYKVEDAVRIVPMPSYADADEKLLASKKYQ